MSFLYHTFFFDPLYNALILLFRILPWADAGLVVIILTALVRLALYPLSRKAVVTQMRMSEIAPEIERIKEKHKGNAEAQAAATLALYREKKINPFSGIIMILIQIPLIFALYRIFLHFSEVRADLLYSFVKEPAHINTLFLGILDVSGKSALLALLAALSTYFQLKFSMKPQPAVKNPSFGDNLTKSMQGQMKYFFPVMVFFISYKVSAVIALYWLTTNLFTIGQELAVRKKEGLA
ncbi:YidC/Oxa1 family membrane protein insertase [Candidatus Parcubacteria bacterium]|nr:YidC/Oxa1 family membrane protein insertase [Candidatus Parcubacteria bacterium]